ncbi:MAG: hypothetical protein HY738_15895 [Bacteroidia bacterium]|nr:hypothetical protein [Bacteroidia bacterium]
MNNKAKRLDFLQKNRLIYAFQKNIVTNQKYSRYYNWFELAEKTLNRLNKKADFLKYMEDEIFVEIIRRIYKGNLKEKDYTYIKNYNIFVEEVKRFAKGFYEEGREDGWEQGREQAYETKEAEYVIRLYKKEKTIDEISDLTGISKDKVKKIIEKFINLK